VKAKDKIKIYFKEYSANAFPDRTYLFNVSFS